LNCEDEYIQIYVVQGTRGGKGWTKCERCCPTVTLIVSGVWIKYVKRLTVDVYALHYVLYLCTLNKSKLAGAAASTERKWILCVREHTMDPTLHRVRWRSGLLGRPGHTGKVAPGKYKLEYRG
jgi:hypothetical protein